MDTQLIYYREILSNMIIKLALATMIFAWSSLANSDEVDVTQSGDDFELSVLQTTGDNYLSGNSTGTGNSVSADQSGSASADFSVANSGGAVDLTIQQNDSTDTVSVTKICTNPAGCSLSVDQR